MAAKSTLKNMVLCLTAVCLFCSAVLGGVYAVTYGPIQKASENNLKASIGLVLPDGGILSDAKTYDADGMSFEYYESISDSAVVAYAVKSTTIGFGGPLSVMVGVLPDGTVYATKVLSHSETPGLGAKCSSDEGFLSQFRGFSPDKKLVVRKDGGDVDAITASTITSRAYTLAVSNAVEVVKSLGGGAFADAFSGASTKNENNENKEEK